MLLHFHGNGEVVGDWVDTFGDALLAAGLNVCFAEYRGYGNSSGWPALAGMLDDALAIADALEVPAGKLFVYGRSVGSLYALHVASQRPQVGLIVESGIADVMQRIALRVSPEEIGASEQEFKDAIEALFDHQAKVEACTSNVLVIHAENDHLVSVDHAKSLAAWAGEEGRLVTFERGDHNTIYAYNSQSILREVVQFAKGPRQRVTTSPRS